jgi:hypothetical protein
LLHKVETVRVAHRSLYGAKVSHTCLAAFVLPKRASRISSFFLSGFSEVRRARFEKMSAWRIPRPDIRYMMCFDR